MQSGRQNDAKWADCLKICVNSRRMNDTLANEAFDLFNYPAIIFCCFQESSCSLTAKRFGGTYDVGEFPRRAGIHVRSRVFVALAIVAWASRLVAGFFLALQLRAIQRKLEIVP